MILRFVTEPICTIQMFVMLKPLALCRPFVAMLPLIQPISLEEGNETLATTQDMSVNLHISENDSHVFSCVYIPHVYIATNASLA